MILLLSRRQRSNGNKEPSKHEGGCLYISLYNSESAAKIMQINMVPSQNPAKINVKNKALCQIVVMNSFCMKGILSQDAFSYAQMSLILLRNWSRFFIA